MASVPPMEEPETRFDIHSINYVYEPHKELQMFTRDGSAVWMVENKDAGTRPYLLSTLAVNKMLRDEYLKFMGKIEEFKDQLNAIAADISEEGRAEQVFMQAMLEDSPWIPNGTLAEDASGATPDVAPAMTANGFHNLVSDIKGRTPYLRRKDLNSMLSTIIPSLLLRRVKLMGVLHGSPIRHAAAIDVSGQAQVADYWNLIRNNFNMPGFFDPKEELGFKVTRAAFDKVPANLKTFTFLGRKYSIGQCLQIVPCLAYHGAPLIAKSFMSTSLMDAPYIRLGYYITHLSQKISNRSYAGVDGVSIYESLTEEQITGLLNSALSRSAEAVVFVSVSHKFC